MNILFYIFSLRSSYNPLMKYMAFILTLFLLTSCGDSGEKKVDKGNQSSTKERIEQVKKTTPNMITRLDTTPIHLDNIFDTSPPKYASMSTCPFLTDKTAINATNARDYVKAGEESKERKEVSNTYCMWLTGILVRILPAKNAITHKKMVANDPKKLLSLKAQDGPGTEATVIYSQTEYSRRRKAKPVLMGFGFFQGDKYVRIEMVLGGTSVDRLRKVADEIATLLPNAPIIETQTQKRVKKVEVCKIWQADALKTLFKKNYVSSRIRGNTGCKFKLSSKKEGNYSLSLVIDFETIIKNRRTCDSLEKIHGFMPKKSLNNYAIFSKTNATSSRIEHHLAACSDQGIVRISTEAFFSHPDLVDKKALQQKYKKELHTLLENIVGRIVTKE